MKEDIIECLQCKTKIGADDYFENYLWYSSDYDYTFKMICSECNIEIEVKRNIHVSYELSKESLTEQEHEV